MGPKQNTLADLINAFHDEGVRAIIGEIVECKLKDLIAETKQLRDENASLSRQLDEANQRIDDLESYTRRDSLIVSGLPLVNMAEAASTSTSTASDSDSGLKGEHTAATESSLLTLFGKMNLKLSTTDISICHRLKSPKKSGPPPVIVKFTNRKARDLVYAARTQLKSTTVYINEDLTKRNSKIFAEARKLVKAKQIYKAWTNKGHVYIKENSQQNCLPKQIKSLTQLP